MIRDTHVEVVDLDGELEIASTRQMHLRSRGTRHGTSGWCLSALPLCLATACRIAMLQGLAGRRCSEVFSCCRSLERYSSFSESMRFPIDLQGITVRVRILTTASNAGFGTSGQVLVLSSGLE
jgi:hypothetical protein